MAETDRLIRSESAQTERWYRLLSLIFGGKALSESVATRIHFEASSPEAVWRGLLFHEEVPDRPPLLLRALLPCPVRTEGDKTRAGAKILCTYKRGNLVKRITAHEMPYLMKFVVIKQHLGIESCVALHSGSYEIRPSGGDTEVVLTTNYQSYLQPRWLWRRLETLAVHQLHNHILNGIREAITSVTKAAGPMITECAVSPGLYQGEDACTASQSHSHRQW